jgi:hypothetical protein
MEMGVEVLLDLPPPMPRRAYPRWELAVGPLARGFSRGPASRLAAAARRYTAHFLGARGSGSGLGASASARGYADAHHFMCSGSLERSELRELTAPQHTAVAISNDLTP